MVVMASLFLMAGHVFGQKGITTSSHASNGLNVTKFSTPEGDIAVYFPGDIASGDMISGTVISQPTGKNEKKMEKNQGVLNGYVFEMEEDKNNKTQSGFDKFQWIIPIIVGGAMDLLMKDPAGNIVASADVPVMTEPYDMSIPDLIDPASYTIPECVQSGMPASISGYFDGSLNNTTILMGGEQVQSLAESPRNCYFMVPDDVTGQTDIQLIENDLFVSGQTNCLDLNVSADKISLIKGENTTIHVTVTGLDSLNQPVSYSVNNLSPGIINLSGGNQQELEITPEQVGPGGMYRQDFSVSAISAGSYSIVAQVSVPPPQSIILTAPEEHVTTNMPEFAWNAFNMPANSTYTLTIWDAGQPLQAEESMSYEVDLDHLSGTEPYFMREGITAQSFDYSKVQGFPLQMDHHYVWQVSGTGNFSQAITSNFGEVFCCPAKPKHIKAPPEHATKEIPEGWTHIKDGVYSTHIYDPEKYDHIPGGNDKTKIVPKGSQHVTVGTDKTKYYPGNKMHLVNGDDYSKLVPKGYKHPTTGCEPTKWFPPASSHIEGGNNKTEWDINVHQEEGPDKTRNKKEKVEGVDPTGGGFIPPEGPGAP